MMKFWKKTNHDSIEITDWKYNRIIGNKIDWINGVKL